MKRRAFSLALATGSLGSSVAWAQNAFRSGKDYITLDKPVATEAGNGRIEVIEFFWYSCPHCNSFEPAFERWAKAVPRDVLVRRVPVAFRPDFEPQQRLYFSLEALNLVETVHPRVFQAIHVEKLPLNTEAAILDWVGRQGVDKARFAETWKSFGVASKVRRAVQLQNDYRIEGVPSLGVAGRYYIDGSLAGSMDRALKVAEALIAQTRGR